MAVKGSRPFEGAVESMLGPKWHGFVDPDKFVLGDKGGMFLIGAAGVSQKCMTDIGQMRLAVYSDEKDNLVVCSSGDRDFLVVEEDERNEGLVWVHRWRQEDYMPLDEFLLRQQPGFEERLSALDTFGHGKTSLADTVYVQLFDSFDQSFKPLKLSREMYERLRKADSTGAP